MGYSSGLLKFRITVLNRKEAVVGKFGLDSADIGWEETACLWADVSWSKGKGALNVGAIDAYAVKMVRTRWTCHITERSRVKYDGKVYKILPDSFHANKQENTVQFLMQSLVNENKADNE